MFKKVICFILLAALVGVITITPISAAYYYGNEVQVVGSLKVKIIYAGLGQSPYTNTNIETAIASNGAAMFQPSVNTDAAYSSFSWRPIFAYTSAPSSNSFSFDYVVDFDNYNGTQYKAYLTFSSPLALDDNYSTSTREGGTFWLERSYWEDYRSRDYHYLKDSYNHSTSAPVIIDSPSAKIHIHLEGTKTSSGNWSVYHAMSMQMVVNSFSIINDTTTLAEYEREQAENQASENENKTDEADNQMNGINNSFDSFTTAVGSLVSAVGSTDTTVNTLQFPAMYIPATTVTPRIELNNIQPIDFGSVINQMPSELMTIVRAVLSIAIYFFAIREVVKLFSNIFGNREDNG